MDDSMTPGQVETASGLSASEPAVYYITVQGCLDARWSEWFEAMALTSDPAANVTTFRGPVADQAALHGLLAKIRDLGLPILAVRCLAQG